MNSLLTYLAFVTLLSCAHKNQPKETVEKHLTAIDHFNYKDAKLLVVQNAENLQSVDNVKIFSQKMTKSEREKYIGTRKVYNYMEKNITDNSAKVIATNNQEDYTVAIEFDMVKENGNWLISKIKSN